MIKRPNNEATKPLKKQKLPEITFSQDKDIDLYSISSSEHSGTYILEGLKEVNLKGLSSQMPNPVQHKRLEETQNPYFKLLANYPDSYILNTSNSQKQGIAEALALHILNHIYKLKSKVQQNTSLKDPPKDQGFNPAQVLVLFPYKEQAKEFLDLVIKFHCKDKKKKLNSTSSQKYNETFGDEEENKVSDAFKFGVCVGDKRELSLYTPFVKSDIILASPLSLKQAVSEPNLGILCSVQIVVLVEAQEFIMQNWDHIEDIFKAMNKLPDRDSVTVDLNRIMDVFLDQNSADFRQLIITSKLQTPLLMSLFNRSKRPKVRTIEHYEGVVSTSPSQAFRKFQASTFQDTPDLRFKYFTESYWPNVKEDLSPQSVVFVESYLEYVRVREYLEEYDPGVLCVSEYTPKPQRQRSFAYVKSAKNKALCITERLIYFRNPKISKIGHLVFYSLPENPEIYTKLVEVAEQVTAVFCKFDGYCLQRIVGDKRAAKMLNSHNDLFTLS